jgi:exodeoxyribonuclease VII large subunit
MMRARERLAQAAPSAVQTGLFDLPTERTDGGVTPPIEQDVTANAPVHAEQTSRKRTRRAAKAAERTERSLSKRLAWSRDETRGETTGEKRTRKGSDPPPTIEAERGMPPLAGEELPVLSVSDFTRNVKALLTAAFPTVRVFGEITGFSRAQSGHVYFTLKDAGAQLHCVLWRTSAAHVRIPLENGLACEARGAIGVYEPRGEYQLVVEEIVPLGAGALQAALEKLTARLLAEGLFAPERKRALPRYPQRIGVVTSPTGAAVRDIIRILRARMPCVQIVVVPVQVQGMAAAASIAAGIDRANVYGALDTLIVGRGGGSPEDLWAFNEEVVVRAIARSAIPVVSAVGHERDTTLADHAADVRAATPTAAAQTVVREMEEIRCDLAHRVRRGHTAMRARVDGLKRSLAALTDRYGFRRPQDLLRQRMQRVDELHGQLTRLAALCVARERDALRGRVTRLRLAGPFACAVEVCRQKAAYLFAALERLARARVSEGRTRAAHYAASLHALGPEQVLKRGYALVRHGDRGKVATRAAEISAGEMLGVMFHDGEVEAEARTVRSRVSPAPPASARGDSQSKETS